MTKAASLSLCLALALAGPAAAETSALEQARLSAEVFALGLEQGDPLMVLAAARMRAGMAFEATTQGAARLPGRTSSVGVGALGGGTPIGSDEMLEIAREMAAGDDALLGLIDDAETEGARGVATGQVYSISEIRDGGTDTYDPLPFSAGEYAEVYVESRDGSDLNLFIYDAQGRLVCSDTDASAISYCGWRPAEAGSFTIEVVNRGKGGAGYALMTN
jgi:hypothetical protein